MIETAITKRRFKQIDVFTAKPCLGNPVAVILDAEGLTTEQMQSLAAWTHLSETVFMLPSDGADYELRIFCPQKELAFAGHPTIGAAHAALEAGIVKNEVSFLQKCRAGIFTLWLADRTIWVRAPRPARLDARPASTEMAGVLAGCAPLDPIMYDAGPVWITARVDSLAELNQAAYQPRELIAFSNQYGAAGVVLYAFRPEGTIEVRTFAPAIGVDEDPACGSGNLAVAAHLGETGGLSRTGKAYTAIQGGRIGRDAHLYLAVKETGIELGGQAVTVFDGHAFL